MELKEAIDNLTMLKYFVKTEGDENWEDYCNSIETVLNHITKQEKMIELLKQERDYIKNNLKVDLNRKGVYSQAKGQISQILEYYENNDKYFEKKAEEAE